MYVNYVQRETEGSYSSTIIYNVVVWEMYKGIQSGADRRRESITTGTNDLLQVSGYVTPLRTRKTWKQGIK